MEIKKNFGYIILANLFIPIFQWVGIVPDRPITAIIFNYLLSIALFIYFIIINKKEDRNLVLLFFCYNLIIFIIAFFIPNSFDATKILISIFPSVFMILSFFYFKKLSNAFFIIRVLVSSYLPIISVFLLLSILGFGFRHFKGYDFYILHPLILFVPYLKNRIWWLFILLACLSLSMYQMPDGRAYIVSALFPIVLVLSHKFKLLTIRRMLAIRVFLLIAPILVFLFVLANTFFLKSKFEIEGDSRSFLYVEVIDHLLTHNSLLWGTTPGLGYSSSMADVEYFTEDGDKVEYYDLWKNGRTSSEAGICDAIHWGGLFNLIVYFLIFYKYSLHAIKYSRNNLCKLLGLYISFRWAFIFIDGSSLYTHQYLSFWLILGLCSSKLFRNLNNGNILYLLRSGIAFDHQKFKRLLISYSKL